VDRRTLAGRPAASERSARRMREDDGSATLEFIALTLILLVPLVYLIIAVGQIQAGAFAVQAAARDAARGAVVEGVAQLEAGASESDALAAASQRAHASAAIAFEDLGVASAWDSATLDMHCDGGECFAPGTDLLVRVDASIPLPGVPSFLGNAVPLAVSVSASASSPVDGLSPAAGLGAP